MKSCAYCQAAPHFHYSRNVTMRRNDGQNYFLLGGCPHLDNFKAGALDAFIPDKKRAEMEAQWDAEADRLFAQYTARWTEAERARYRTRLWPVPPPVIPAELLT